MKIHGLQKMTLLDYPGKVACTVFFGGCDLRCPFCHNSDLLDVNAPALMEEDELLSFLKKRQGLLEGVCLTGGEPLMRPDLPELCRKIKTLGYPIKLDTNGFHPGPLRALIEEGLIDCAAMDIKNSPERYAMTCGRDPLDLAPLKESIALLLEGRIDYEFRTTAVAEFHDDASFAGIAELIRGAGKYFIQKFTDRDSVMFAGLHAPSKEDMLRWADIVKPSVGLAELRGTD
ncbi:MAG: anaerobic ribonucleoside-triphosphate reductase activating protein [Lachnospiraceae bacterium]|nr:anaerobic ribonucleoside-triphosphate reductase activating protein [Lachnospiraceae bacterium]